MSGNAPKLIVESIDLFDRDVTLRMPFRFGALPEPSSLLRIPAP